MDSILVLKGRLQEFYAKYSLWIDKLVQFILAFATFYLINDNVGFLKAAASPVVAVALAVICTFLPVNMTIIAATMLILAHMYAVSLAALAVTGLVFLVMYIFYFRLAPKMALIVLLTPIAFVMKVPYIIPVACGLLSAPISFVAIACGTIVYYMMEYVKKASAGMKGEDTASLMEQMSAYIKQVFQNKELWIVIAAAAICVLVVYAVRRLSVDHAWKIAIIAGAVVNVIVVGAGDFALGVTADYTTAIVGSVAAIVVGLLLELIYFSVDYARSEKLQYEDDEYYYYVKAIPKLSVSTPEKTVKKINERQETEIFDTEEVRRKTGWRSRKQKDEEVDRMLLTQSLQNDPDLR